MAEKLLINVAHEETRVALVSSGRISNLEIDTSRVDNNKGNIYKGVVHRVNDSLQAAFVDYGADKQGFLPVSEIHSRYYPKALKGKKVPIKEILHQGQELMVQIVKDEIGTKGASLTTYTSLPGRYLVLMADSDKEGISRRVGREERSRLKKIIASLPVPEGFGVIVRTAGVEREERELAGDLEYLSRLWTNLQERYGAQKGAGLIHLERNLAARFIRDYATADLDEIVVDNKDAYDEIRDFCTLLAEELRTKVRYYDDSRPLFSRYQIEDQIDDIFARKIDLPSGGSIVIDQAEALVAIDVNSGRVKTDDIEQTALTTNLEAAAEVARQLKIRDRGGLVIIDFIDMRDKTNIKKVEVAVRQAFAEDKAKVKFSRISEFGLMEISRQRLQSSLMKGSFTPCRACGGTGQVRSVESSALYLLRRLKETVIRGNYMYVQTKMPVAIANYILNRKRADLVELEQDSGTSLEVKAAEGCPPMTAYFELLTKPGKSRRPRRILHTIDLVRSDVDKKDIEGSAEIIMQQAESMPPTPSREKGEITAANREMERQMAAEKEVQLAQREADESLRRQRESQERAKALEAEAALEREKLAARKAELSLVGRIRAFFLGLPPVEVPSVEAPAEREASTRDKRGGRTRRGDGRAKSGEPGTQQRSGSGRRRGAGDKGGGRGRDTNASSTERGTRSGDGRGRSRGANADKGVSQGAAKDGNAKQGAKKAKASEESKTTEQKVVASSGGGDELSAAEPSKKRRRRRRRRRSGEGGEAAAVSSEASETTAGADDKAAKPQAKVTTATESKGRSGRAASKPRATKSEGADRVKDAESKAAPVPKAGGVIDLRGGVVDLRGGRGKSAAKDVAPSQSKDADKPPAKTEKAGGAAEGDKKPKKPASQDKTATADAKTKTKAATDAKTKAAADAKTKAAADAKTKAAADAKAKATADAKAKAEAPKSDKPKATKAKASAPKTDEPKAAKAKSADASAGKGTKAANGDKSAAKAVEQKAKPARKKPTTKSATTDKKAAKASESKRDGEKKAAAGDKAAKKAPEGAPAGAADGAGAGTPTVRERLAALRAQRTNVAPKE